MPDRARTHDPDSVLTPDVDPAETAAPPAPHAPPPDISKLGHAMERQPAVRSVALTLLFVLASFYTLYFARAFFLPVVFAILLAFLFSPVVRALRRAHIPEPLGALVVVVGLLGALALGVYQLSDPVQKWVDRAPRTLSNAAAKIRKIRRPVEQVTRTAEQVEQATTGAPGARATQVVVTGPSLAQRFLAGARELITSAIETVVLLYFLLAAGDLFLQKLIKVLPAFQDKKTAVEIARQTEASVSTYLFTVALINLGEGIVVSLAMWALGMPNPPLWGVLIFFLEFVPYLGAFVFIAVLILAAVTTFDSLAHALLVPATYLAINLLQAYAITPMLLGRRLTLNPVAILVGLILWFQIWGIAGAFIAVPLLSTFKIVCDHIETLAPVGEFLGD
jgi:predicted PurR-regulated permease PerM